MNDVNVFMDVKIIKSGRELKNAINARLNLSDMSEEKRLPPNLIAVLKMFERNLTDNFRYELNTEETLLLNL